MTTCNDCSRKADCLVIANGGTIPDCGVFREASKEVCEGCHRRYAHDPSCPHTDKTPPGWGKPRHTLTTPFEPLEHVYVDISAPAHVSVRCAGCGSVTALYHAVLHKDPDALRRAVEEHKGCGREAA